jgi:peptide chain release factor 1
MQKQSILVEVRSSEGGEESRLLCEKQSHIYLKQGRKKNLEAEILTWSANEIIIRFTGKGAVQLFAQEGGVHKWCRFSPTSKGKSVVHTSFITVAVLPIRRGGLGESHSGVRVRREDLEITATRGSGKGGQKRNKTSNCVHVFHRPSGVKVRCESDRSQHRNKENAIAIIEARLASDDHSKRAGLIQIARTDQIGDASRSKAIRTYKVRTNTGYNHVTGTTFKLDAWEKGKLLNC